MSEDIKKGDMVRLKSGGPTMMVDSVGSTEWTPDVRVWCEWFDDKNNAQSKDFAITSVEKVPPSPSAASLASRGPQVL
jgi:uncharacterized protein YodC (DUF2158 family)